MSKYLVPGLLLVSSTFALAAEPVTYYGDIRSVMEDNCLTCHTEKSVSFSFENPETAYSFHAAIADAVAERRMPPWLPEPGHQEYVDDYSLSAQEVQLFADWAAGGFAKGEPVQGQIEQTAVQYFEADLTVDVQPDFAYLPVQTRKDDYRCFLVDWPYAEDKYMTGFRAEPGNLKIAHHLVLFAVPPESADYLRMLSKNEEGPGHQCFGGVMPDKVADSNEARAALDESHPGQWQKAVDGQYWLAHWAPGIEAFVFPEKTGVLVKPGSLLVVQMHYYSAYAPGQTDGTTRMLIQVEDQVEKPSINYPMTNNQWLDSDENGSMVIPAGESRTFETGRSFTSIRNRASRILGVDPDDVEAVELRSANLHMHAFGASGRISLLHANGEKETLLNVPDWDLDWQADFRFVNHKTIPANAFDRTRLTVECTFSNYTEETVIGGYGSYDEMCFNFSYVSLVRKSQADGEGKEVVASP